jgi:hypothetical protein
MLIYNLRTYALIRNGECGPRSGKDGEPLARAEEKFSCKYRYTEIPLSPSNLMPSPFDCVLNIAAISYLGVLDADTNLKY